MNKTVNINLGGYFFHIDENAYQKLQHYLDAIARSLSDDPQGKKEIIADIEARISELLSEKITDKRQVVNESQIDEIIAIMGQPEDYGDGEDIEQPKQKTVKKLFRDNDDKFLGGVCSGLGYFVGVDNIWVRLFFLVITLLGYGFGILAYIILWILVPVAKTTSEKLEMKGEPVNIDNIEKKIREDIDFLSQKLKNGADNIDYEQLKHKSKSGFHEMLDVIGEIIKVLLKIAGKFFGVILLIISAVMIIALIIAFFSFGSVEILNTNIDFVNYPPFFYTSLFPHWLLATCLFLAIIIPFIGFFIVSLRMLSANIKRLNLGVTITLLVIWLISIFVLIFSGVEYGLTESSESVDISKKNIVFDQTKPLKIGFKNDNKIHYFENLRHKNNSIKVSVNNENKKYSNNIYFNVKETEKDTAYVEIVKKSNIRINSKGLHCDIDKIIYNFENTDNKLLLDAYFLSDYKNMRLKEKINVNVYIPKETTIFFEESSKYFIYNIKNIDGIYDREMSNHHFKMTKKGLKCLDCKDTNNDEAINVNLNNLKIDINEEGVNVNSDEVDLDINEKGAKLNVKKD